MHVRDELKLEKKTNGIVALLQSMVQLSTYVTVEIRT